MDAHRLAEERSLAYHLAVADRIESQPQILARARARVRGAAAGYAGEWARILDMPVEHVKRALVDPSEPGKARRQSTPFAGALDPRERWRLWREVRERVAR